MQNSDHPAFRVKRQRRRLYEPASADGVGIAQTDTDARTAKRLAKAQDIVAYYTAQAGIVGVLPVPWVDMLAAGALQLKLIRELCALYDMPFAEHRAKAALAALFGGLQTGLLVGSAVKYIPVFGFLVGAIPAIVTTAGLTYAIGKVFIQHFELGGTLLDLDAAKIRAYLRHHADQKTE